MKSFKDFKIAKPAQAFAGDKIALDRILNKQVIVHQYKILPSTKKPGTDCLHISLQVDGDMRLFFTGSKSLITQIEQVDKADFPFTASITKEDRQLSFT